MSSKSTSLYSVSSLTFAIKNQLESSFGSVEVQGEISNFKAHSSGHYYFDLKDQAAKVPAVLFKGSQKGLPRPPKEGDQVVLRGALSVYPPHGRYQMIVRELTFAGTGALLLQLEKLKQELKARGWFAHETKKELPAFPKKIGIVTSPTGAVIRDIINVIRRRAPGSHLILNPVHVQGPEAAGEIAQAIQQFNRYQLVDLLIVGRGGGSLEDLWPFNEEIVAKAIFESEIPIISAVGHETDFTIADLVADVRAPTPSAAAELAVSESLQHTEFLRKTSRQLTQLLKNLLFQKRSSLTHLSRHPLIASPLGLLSQPMQRLDECKFQLDQGIRYQLKQRRYQLEGKKKEVFALKPTTQIRHLRHRLAHFEKTLTTQMRTSTLFRRTRLKQIVSELKALDPKNVLKRGYAILFAQKENSVIVSKRQLAPKQSVRALLADGDVKLTVDNDTI